MTKHLVFFIAAFIGGAVVALAVRSARFEPHAGAPAAVDAPAYAPMVNNTPPAPAAKTGSAAPAAGKTVNTVCPICGMDVNPALKPAEYQGKLVGFGCKTCPAQFAAEPDRYGPAALENKVVEN